LSNAAASGFSDAQIASKAGLIHSAWLQMKNGNRKPSPGTVRVLAEAIRRPAGEFAKAAGASLEDAPIMGMAIGR
jgi:transcriptional regulator with XRE-family HTH domain